jgi:lysyl-tRNA synthetase class 1
MTKENIHWADVQAEAVIERCKKKGKDITVCRSGQSPSGPKHIGNMCDNIRSFFVARAIQEKGFKSKHIQSHDDRDPLRKIPPKIADLDGNWKVLAESEIRTLEKHLGEPYSSVPDPFGCCNSWGKHFSNLVENGAKMIGLASEYVSNDELYKKGLFRSYVRKILEKIELTRKIIKEFQETRPPNYIPFDVICESCRKITAKATAFDLNNETIDYSCETKKLAGEYKMLGCGHKGTVNFNGGKLPWRFEWPAQWCILEADFEPVGKEHAEGSWPSGEKICKEIYESEPVIPFFNEFFLVDGKKMSTREGNAYTIQDMMKIIEPEPFKMFYAKRPMKQRDFSVREIFRLVDEFDKAERIFFGAEKEKEHKEENIKHKEENIKRMYELSRTEIPKTQPTRIPYSFYAAVSQIAQTFDRQKTILRNFGYAEPDPRRIALAKNWVKDFASLEYKIKLLEKLPKIKTDETVKEIFEKIAEKIEESIGGEELQQFIYNEAQQRNIAPPKVFSTAYQILLGKDKGPRLGPFLVSLDKNFAINRLRFKL